MKLSTVAVFGAGYVLGTRAGRQRYDQLRVLAGRMAEGFDGSVARQRLQEVSARLEAYARNGAPAASDSTTADGRRAQTRA